MQPAGADTILCIFVRVARGRVNCVTDSGIECAILVE
jgi:hypothetical protein